MTETNEEISMAGLEGHSIDIRENKETKELNEMRDKLIDAIRKDQADTCEEILRKVKDIGVKEEVIWKRFEICLNQPIFYFAVLQHAWETIESLVKILYKNRFLPHDLSLCKEPNCEEKTAEQTSSKGERNDQSELEISKSTGPILRTKNQIKTVSCEEKLQESLVLLLKNNKVSLIEKFLRCITNSDTRKMLISTTKNELGNFLIHVAARNNLTELFEYVKFDSNVTETNLMGETALHLAAEGGSLEAVRRLMEGYEKDSESVVYVRDVQGNTPLHSAVKTRHPKPEIVGLLADAYGREPTSAINKLRRSPLHVAAIHMSSTRNDYFNVIQELRAYDPNAVDFDKETALQIAAKKVASHMSSTRNNCINVIQELRAFDPNAVDFEKETALHIALKKRNFTVLEAMLEVFYGLHKDVYSHNKDKNGYSLLDICAMNADLEAVTLLLDYGADPRDGVLFQLVSESVRVPERSNDLVKVYRTLIDQADKWSRLRSNNDHTVESVFRKAIMIDGAIALNFKKHTSENIIKLLNEKDKKWNVNVIEHAVNYGAVEILEAFLHTEHLYEDTEHLYEEHVKTANVDATYRFMVKNCLAVENGWAVVSKTKSRKKALIERIANHDDETIAARMFNIEPLRSLVKNHIMIAQLVYGLLTVAQIIYMAFFIIYHIPNVCRFEVGRGGKFNECTNSDSYYQNQFSKKFASKSTTRAYIIWPMLLLTFAILFNIRSTLRNRKWTEWLDIWKYAFPVIVIVWLSIFQYPNAKYDSHVACTALVFIIGWLHVFYFISFFKRFNIFALLLKEIILKDFVNFVVLMAILLLGFSCAIITLYQTPKPGTFSYRSLTGTAYRAFFDTLSPGSTFLNETTNTNFQEKGGKLHLLRIVIVVYEILTFVILFNILIAMMSDTYNKKIADAERIARLCLIKHGINLRVWWPFGRHVNEVYLSQELVRSIIKSKNVSKKRRNLWQDIRDYVKPNLKFMHPSRSVLHD